MHLLPLIFLADLISESSSANILAIFPIASPSHHIWNSPLVVSLAKKGHNVTILSPEAQETPIANLTNIVIANAYEDVNGEYGNEELPNIPFIQWVPEVYEFMGENCKYAIQSSGFKTLMNYPKETKFDILITEASGAECLLGVIPKFHYPALIIVNAYSIPTWVWEMTGTPNIPSHMPHFMYPVKNTMSFFERVINVYFNIYGFILYHFNYLPAMDKVAKEYFGSKTPDALHFLKNVSIVMSNFHPVLDFPWAIPPNLIPVGGIQITSPKPLPGELQKFLDDATEGVIFFSLGSNVRSDQLSPQKLFEILSAFREIPQQVLWKFESEQIKDLPKNVKIGKWFPQSDILAHPNMKLFISHCGLLSTHEAVHRGVPVVGIPFLADQHINVRKLMFHGAAVLLEYRDISKESLLTAINTVLYQPCYKENMQKISEKFRDNPMTPLETAVFWTEYVIRHNGATHLQLASLELSVLQYYMIDVLAFIFIFPVVSFIFLYILYNRICLKRGNKLKYN